MSGLQRAEPPAPISHATAVWSARFDVEATGGIIELRFYGDETQFRKDQQRYEQWFAGDKLVDSYLGTRWDPKRRLKFDPKGPFTRNSVLAIRVAPHRDSLFEWRGGKLMSTADGSGNQDAFVAAFNRGHFRKAEAIMNLDESGVDLRVRGFLALLGHPRIEGKDEQRVLSAAQQAVADSFKSDAPSVWAIEARDSLDIFSRARQRFLNRGMAEEGHFQENRKAVSMMRIFSNPQKLCIGSISPLTRNAA